jgi:ferredoxin
MEEIMAKNIIFCFSGTGNSLKVAKDIASVIGETEIIFMKNKYELDTNYERIGFIFPCYASGIPQYVVKYIRNLELTKDSTKYIFSIVSCNIAGGNSLSMLDKELIMKRLKLNYGKSIPMVGNYIVLYSLKKEIEESLTNAYKETLVYANDIKIKIETKIPKPLFLFKIKYKLGNIFFSVKSKQFVVSEDCILCKLCEKLCPTGNIIIKNNKPFFDKKCIQCMACIQWCPKNAINCGKHTKNRKRYHHPEIKVEELIHKKIGKI